jgi:hypothetical protein
MGYAKVYAELRALSMQELVELYDAYTKNTVVGLSFIREEIARREAETQTAEIIRLTRVMKWLTVAIAVMTAISMVLVAVATLS